MNECLVYHADAARGGVVPCEVPVAWMLGASLMQTFDALEHQFYWRIHSFGTKHLHDFSVYLVDGEWGVDSAHMVV